MHTGYLHLVAVRRDFSKPAQAVHPSSGETGGDRREDHRLAQLPLFASDEPAGDGGREGGAGDYCAMRASERRDIYTRAVSQQTRDANAKVVEMTLQHPRRRWGSLAK